MSEVILDKFVSLAESQSDIKSYSWASVFDLLLRYEGLDDLQHEDVVMACGEGFAFAYSPYHYAPMYLGLRKSGVRVRNFFGYSVIWLKGPAIGGDLEIAWDFIRTNLDINHGIHVEGPESFLIYGYKDSELKKDRLLNCIANWGPGLNGEITWKQFSSYSPLFSFSTIRKTNLPLPREENTKFLLDLIQKYNNSHPGIGSKLTVQHEVTIEGMKGKEFELSESNYGIKGFETFLKDVQDDKMVRGMLQTYLCCHAINFHMWGRQWQSKWFKKRANDFKGELKELFIKVSDAYYETAANLKEFTKINNANDNVGKLHEKISNAIPSLKKAYESEKVAVEVINEIVEELLTPKEAPSLEETVRETLYAGMGAGDTHIDPFTALEGLKEEDLQKKPAENVMNLWEQFTHLQFWHELTLQNIKEGKPHWSKVDWSEYPPDYKAKYGGWKEFHKVICDSILEIQQIIMDKENLAERYPDISNVSFIHLVRFLCSHLSYHIAQIVMTRKILGLWPPLGRFTSYHLI